MLSTLIGYKGNIKILTPTVTYYDQRLLVHVDCVISKRHRARGGRPITAIRARHVIVAATTGVQ
jgi:hypothetical protein